MPIYFHARGFQPRHRQLGQQSVLETSAAQRNRQSQRASPATRAIISASVLWNFRAIASCFVFSITSAISPRTMGAQSSSAGAASLAGAVISNS